MKSRRSYVLGLVAAAVLVISAVPASAAGRHGNSGPKPLASVTWAFGPSSPFSATRFDGEYVGAQNRVYFLGFRSVTGGIDTTDGSIWYLDVATSTYVDTTIDMPVPVSNYQIAALTDSHGLGLWIFGGRDANGALIDTVQVYYPVLNQVFVVASDPWPGTTPAACISLPAMGVATLANRAFVLGGLSFAINGCVDDQSAQTWIFNPNAPAGSRWSQGPDLNVARGYITPAVLNGKIYAIGGDTNVLGTPTPVQTVEAWKPPTGGWNDTAVKDTPLPCDESQAFPFATGPLAGDIVVANCGQWPNAVANTLIYSAIGNSWVQGGLINENRRNEAGAFIKVGGKFKLYILGGFGEATQFVDSIQTSEVGTPGANSSGDRPVRMGQGSSRASVS
jgi:hypothetical protein